MAEIASPAPRPQPGDIPWRQPARGGYPDPSLIGLPGIEQLRAMLEGRVPQPPLSRLTGQRLIDVAPGLTTFEMPLTRWLCSSQGPISIGPLAVPADGAMATAIQTELPPASPYSTSELSLRLLSTARPGGCITARGRVIHRRRTIALSEVHLTDDEGRLVGHGTTLCFVAPPVKGSAPPQPLDVMPEPAADQATPDPFERPAQGTILGQETFERHSGLEVLRAQIAGDLPPPPIHYLLGLAPESAAAGEAAFVLPVTEWLCAPPPGRAQGGFIALLAEAGVMGAIQTKLPAGTAFAPIDLKVNFLRPLSADGREARAAGRVLHAGRRIAVASADVRDADGKPVAVATGSAMLLPGRPASLGIPSG
ncbi:MAG: PaaI family thioesterase [Actinomycetota bacterium]|nr:PaaI family thioesterase [Actinomycetota bacterium]